MTVPEKIAELRAIIDLRLSPLVDRDYRLLEIPDYPNVGDILIYNGERNFLRRLPRKCKEQSTMISFAMRLPRIPETDLLIFRGGGYFGDLWPAGPNFQKMVLKHYPVNPMVIFPQSVFFSSQENLRRAVELYGAHKNLSICLRDRQSYDFIRNYFSNPAYLIPDMAFYAKSDSRRYGSQSGRTCIVKRCDQEYIPTPDLERLCNISGVTIADWPSMTGESRLERIMSSLRRRPKRGGKFYDAFTRRIYCPLLLGQGKRFIAKFDKIVTTRLHAGILGMLLGKEVVFIDNSYGKIRSLYDTWLKDCDSVEMV